MDLLPGNLFPDQSARAAFVQVPGLQWQAQALQGAAGGTVLHPASLGPPLTAVLPRALSQTLQSGTWHPVFLSVVHTSDARGIHRTYTFPGRGFLVAFGCVQLKGKLHETCK